jgi:hypothetical protein
MQQQQPTRKGGRERFSSLVLLLSKYLEKRKKKQFNKTKVVSQLLLLVLFLHPGGWRRAQVRERERERAWASQREAARFSPRAPLLFVSRSGSPRVIFFFSCKNKKK